jgi:hypothetical protein
MARQAKTDEQRAREALGVAQRKVERLNAEMEKHAKARDDAKAALAEALERRDYLAQDPALPQPEPEPQPGPEEGP